MKRIVAAVDFSAASQEVIQRAAAVAEAFSAELELLHVAAPDPDFVGYDAGPRTVRESRAKELRDEHRDLQKRAEELRGRGLAAEALLIQGPTVDTIVDHAAQHGADLVVLGSHGHGSVYRALMGSVSEGVLRKVRCPILIVPPDRSQS